MTAPSFTYSGNVYTGAAAGSVDFALVSTTGNAIAYLQSAHIHVYKSADLGASWTELSRPSQWDFVSAGSVARLVTGISAGEWVKVQRITPSTSAYVTFQSSSLLTADQLNDDTLFNTYLNQERYDQGDQATATANGASSTAASALAAVAQALNYSTVANVGAIPGSPINGDAVRVTDSTGIQSFSPLTGIPGGFAGSSALTVEIYYNGAGATWVWSRYFPTDPESRYLTQSNAASTYLTQSNAASTYLSQSSAASTYQTQAGMSSYVATSAIGSTVQAYDVDTAKTDVAQNFTAAQRGSYVTLTDAATIATDLSLGNHFQVTLAGNRVLGAPTNVVAGQSGVIRVVQDGSGSKTLSYNSIWKFPGGTAPTLTTTANAVDLVAYHVESATRIAARFIGDMK